MSMKHVQLVYMKELRETLRDRRTIRSMIIIPVLVMPLLIFGMFRVSMQLASKAQQESASVMLLNVEGAPTLAERIRASGSFDVVPPSSDYPRLIEEKQLRAAIEFPPDFEMRLAADEPAVLEAVKIYHYEGEMRSSFAVEKLKGILIAYRDDVVQRRLAARNLSSQMIKPFEVQEQNVASAEKVGGTLLGGLIPYMIVIITMTGAMYPAIDLTAGEKERGTIETILASPVPRSALAVGKFLTVLTISFSSALLSLLSLSLSLRRLSPAGMGGEAAMLNMSVSPKAGLAVLAMILPVAIMFSAALLAIALLAKSYKEAQSYLSPLMIVVVLPAIGAMLPGVEIDTRLALIPILNVSLVSKEILTGTYHWNYILLILASSTAYAAIALVVAARTFQRESVLFRT